MPKPTGFEHLERRLASVMPEMPDTKTQIYMPLRSNAAWFGDENCRQRLERQIKSYLILYDQIIFENGRVRLTVLESGTGAHMQYPGNTFPDDRTKITYYEPGTPFSIRFGETPAVEHVALQGVAQATYEVDFLPIVHDAGLTDATFIRWSTIDVDGILESEINSRVWNDSFDKSLCAVLPENRYLRDHVLKGLYRDSIIARHLGMPLSVDEHAIPVLELKQRRAIGLTSICLTFPNSLGTRFVNFASRRSANHFGEWSKGFQAVSFKCSPTQPTKSR